MGGGDELGPVLAQQVDQAALRDGRDGDPGHPSEGVLDVQGRVHLERRLGEQGVAGAPAGRLAALEDAGVAGDDDVDGLRQAAGDALRVGRGVHGDAERGPAPPVEPERARHDARPRRLPQELRLRPHPVVEVGDGGPGHDGLPVRLTDGGPRQRAGGRDDHRVVTPGAEGPHVPQGRVVVPPGAHDVVDAGGGEERSVDVVGQRTDLLGARSGLPEPVQRTGPALVIAHASTLLHRRPPVTRSLIRTPGRA